MPLELQVFIEALVLCLVFWFFCYLGTGGDQKNIKSYATYPDKVQEIVRNREDLKGHIRVVPWYTSFISNVVIFTILTFICTVWSRQDVFWKNFVIVLIVGESLNLFDFLVMDMCWWRNTKRIRFSGTEEQGELYKPIKKHFMSFLRGIPCFIIVALIVGGVITAF